MIKNAGIELDTRYHTIDQTPVRCLILLLTLFSIDLKPVFALDLDVRSSSANMLDFSFLVDFSTIELVEDTTAIETNINRAGVVVYDVPESGPHFGLALGYAFGDFNSNPLYQPISMDGWYIGILARGIVLESGRFVAAFEGYFIYQDISGSNDVTNASLSWNEFSINATLKIALTKHLQLYAAPVYGGVAATYRERGSSDITVKMDNDVDVGYFAGLQYLLDARESVSLQYQDAVFKGVTLNFRRIF